MISGPSDDETNGGFNVILVEPLPNHLKCGICFKLMRDPLQTIRGELACEPCYIRRIGSSGICPIDGEAISPNGYFKDKFKYREIQNLECFCYFKENGCAWMGKVAELEDHQPSCSYLPNICPLCNCQVVSSNNDHARVCAALVDLTVCVFAEYGCNRQILSIEDHIDHIEKDFLIHAVLQKTHSDHLLYENQLLRQTIENHKKTSNEEELKMSKEIGSIKAKVLSLTNTITDMQSRFEGLSKSDLVRSRSKNSESKVTGPSDTDSDANEQLAKISGNVAAMDKKISELDLKQQLYENSTYNGKILWKIDNFNFRMQQAVIGRVSVLHSAPCFTENNGYRFCGRLYLNGDGMGKCTHISVFFVLMKSEYDNLLQWPFTRKVKFRLINQNDASRSIEESFLPDRFSSSFQQPTRDMNVAAGCPMFARKEDLEPNGFVKDNAAFIEITVL